MKKSTLNTLVIICVIVIGMFALVRISSEAQLARFIAERNLICGNMSVALSAEDGIDDCYCYYEGFNTGDAGIDSQTMPLCACECLVNGTLTRVGVLASGQ